MKKLYLLAVPLLLTAVLCFNLQVYGESPATGEIAAAAEAGKDDSSVTEDSSENIATDPTAATDKNSLTTNDESTKSIDKSETVDTEEEIVEASATDRSSDVDANINAGIDSDSDTDSDSETEVATESDTEEDEEVEPESEPEPEPEEPDPFAGEPYAQSSLKDIENYLERNHELAEKSAEFSERALAIIAGSSEDRNFLRQCEFLTRVANHNVYAAGLALIIMPRLLEVSNLVCENSTKTLMNTFADELHSETLAREIRLSELSSHLNSQAELAKLLRQLSSQIDSLCDQAVLQNSRRHVQGRIPEFLRAVNRDMIALIKQQRAQLDRLLDQLDLHHQFCQVNLEYFLSVSNDAPSVMQSSQLARIRRSCLDFAVSLRNYRAGYEAFAYKFTGLIESRLADIEKLAGNNSRINARIADFTGNFPARDRDSMSEAAFSAVETLQQTFVLLDTMRKQSERLMHDESSAASSDDNQIVPETFEQLKAELSRHLDSANWPIKPRRELEEQDEPETEDQL
ncbi:MAG: hypothetical protein CVV42_14300 [Candidatus Riflebacteria bacterium HGW-Riflebacteria-2]|jgi:hypothetical protein|nr:MAG: hypothetical protein CVV42_14300 [Candidatus Riflebacteria bacterium HGW-Riflebacteria-2]